MEKKLFNKILIINAIFFVLMTVTDVLYITLGKAYTFKTLASLVFVACCFCNIVLMIKAGKTSHKAYFVLLFVGQIFAMAGDILLIDFFEIGAISFAVGHVFYFIAYLTLQKFKLIDILFVGVVIGISLTVIFVSNINLGNMLPLILAYAIIISSMLGKSASLFLGNKKTALIIFIGSLMFFLSDMFLMFEMFGGMGRIGSILCLGFYYPAQFVIALTTSVVGYNQEKTEKISN